MESILYIDANIRGTDSRTRSIAEPVLSALSERYEIRRIDLTASSLRPITASSYEERKLSGPEETDTRMAKLFADANRIVVSAPFWDMSFPSVLKVFFERISISGITFETLPDNSTEGRCRAEKLLYITTRGMEIETGAPFEQATPYLRALCWLWGIPEVIAVAAIGMDTSSGAEHDLRLDRARAEGLRVARDF